MRLLFKSLWLLSFVFLLMLLPFFSLFLSTRIVSAAPPSNFQSETLILNLTEPTAITFAPDGRMLILERSGTIQLVISGATQVITPSFLQLTNINTDQGERGLVGITLDPNFASNGYYYIFYTANSPLRDRVSRFTANGNGSVTGSEVVIWEDNVTAGYWHHAGTVAFGPDGKLYISVGEHVDTGFGFDHVSQRLDSYHGKILRVNKDGTIPSDNPFYDGVGPNLDAIWARGLRNPFRFSFDSSTGNMYIADVGGNTDDSIEELNLGVVGANYGWPLCEGTCNQPGMTNPIFGYSHNSRDASITGGFIYRGSQFPSQYQGSYLYGDYAQNWIRYLTFDSNGAVTGNLNFEPATGELDGPFGDIVDLKMGPDGALYYVDIGINWQGGTTTGSVRRIRYNSTNQSPVITVAQANPSSGPGPILDVNFEAVAYDPENQAITYTWDFGDGITSTVVSPTHTYQQKGSYTARLMVADAANQTLSGPISIIVGIPPLATITLPNDGYTFKTGEVITFTGIASDADGLLTNANLSWTVVLSHAGHIHPAYGPINGVASGSFSTAIGHELNEDTGFRIILTVTDSDGLKSKGAVLIFPEIPKTYLPIILKSP